MIAVAVCAAPAGAFYWYGWPGGPHPPKTVVPPGNPPGTPPDTPPPDSPPPDTPPSDTPPVNGVPEPATALAALAGLGTLAASRLWRRKGRQATTTPTSTS
jgi:hypothetical protein